MQQVCTEARKSAGGLDNFSPEDFSFLSEEMFNWIAALRNTIAGGAAWPTDVCVGRAAFLFKDPADTENPLAYRVLLILPVL